MRRHVLAAAAALLLAAAPLAAQEASPEALAARALAVTSALDFEALTRLIHPAELDRVQHVFAELLEMDPDPNILAVFDVASVAEFRKLPPHDVMLAFLEMSEVQQNLRSVQILDGRVLGIVREGADDAHAVVRQTIRMLNFEISAPDIISMRRGPDGWWLLMGPELEGMLVGIEASMREARN